MFDLSTIYMIIRVRGCGRGTSALLCPGPCMLLRWPCVCGVCVGGVCVIYQVMHSKSAHVPYLVVVDVIRVRPVVEGQG